MKRVIALTVGLLLMSAMASYAYGCSKQKMSKEDCDLLNGTMDSAGYCTYCS